MTDALRKPAKRKTKWKPWNKGLRQVLCLDCDGCGWYEGGATLKTTCKACKGTGKIWCPRD